MFFNADEYRRIGGHEAVKDKIVEDVCMGIEVGKRHGRHLAIDLSPVTSTNMYVDVGDAWHGFGKSIQGIVAMNPAGIIGLIISATFFTSGRSGGCGAGFSRAARRLMWRGFVLFQIAVVCFY